MHVPRSCCQNMQLHRCRSENGLIPKKVACISNSFSLNALAGINGVRGNVTSTITSECHHACLTHTYSMQRCHTRCALEGSTPMTAILDLA